MDKIIIEGKTRLNGTVNVSGSKNSALPILAATLLTEDTCVLKNIPALRDTHTMCKLLQSLGKEIERSKSQIIVRQNKRLNYIAAYDLVSTMRGSFCVLGPLLAKLQKVKVSLPGGCVIGIRPVDLHLKGIKALGAKVSIENGYVVAKAKRLKGSYVYLGGVFGSSVLATANIMMAATLAEGKTIIESAACEPEIKDLAGFLRCMGAKIKGAGSPQIVVTGVKQLKGARYKIIPDRIEAGTFMLMAAATKSPISIKGAVFEHLIALVDKMKEAGVSIYKEGRLLKVKPPRVIKPVSITTHPYPGFPTDLQAQFLAFMSLAKGISIITDKVYPDRFIHIAELNRMGANIRREGINAISEGDRTLFGAPVMASDLRASAALVIAGLAAQGRTEIHRIYHLERGYEDLEKKLSQLGAKIYRAKDS
jgi:UDP-N-acetylglucosamine 1-carboxyvinyltransferase